MIFIAKIAKITKQDLPSVIIWWALVAIASYYWYMFVFKGGAEKAAGKGFMFKGTIFPSMSAKSLKIIVTLPYLFLIGVTLLIFTGG